MKNNNSFTPIKFYSNALDLRSKILKDNQGLAGIYLFTNLINEKQYVGSSVDLPQRLRYYYSNSAILKVVTRGRSHIYSAILNHGLENFSLSILEYCDKKKCKEREKFYISLYCPAYNIIQDTSLPPMLGRYHYEETIKKMSDSKKGKTHSKEHNAKISASMKGRKGPVQPNAIKIEVTDLETNTITYYNSIREVARI
jgi:group I intron endonuclease